MGNPRIFERTSYEIVRFPKILLENHRISWDLGVPKALVNWVPKTLVTVGAKALANWGPKALVSWVPKPWPGNSSGGVVAQFLRFS